MASKNSKSIVDNTPNAEPATKPLPFGLLPTREFLSARRETEYLIEDVLAKGGPCVVGGPAKCLKTLTLIDMAVSLGTGTPFLGRFPTRKTRVAFFSGESGADVIARRVRAVAESRGIDANDADVCWSSALPSVPADVDMLRGAVVATGAEVVVIDPAYLAFSDVGSNANNLFVMGKALRSLDAVATATGCQFVVAHHLNESLKVGRSPELRHLAFSGFSQWSRQWLFLNRRKRFADGSGLHELRLSAGGSAGHSGAWALDVTDREGGKDVWRVGLAGTVVPVVVAPETKVLKSLEGFPDGDTISRIRERAKLDLKPAKSVVDRLCLDGLLEPCKVVKNNRPEDGFRLTDKGRESVGLVGR